MSIEVTCSNIVRWDSDQNKYVACGHRFSASDALAGTFVECPKCASQLEIPNFGEPNLLSALEDDEPFPTISQPTGKWREKPDSPVSGQPGHTKPQPRGTQPVPGKDTVDDFLQASIGEQTSTPAVSKDAEDNPDEYTLSPLEGGGGLGSVESKPLAYTPSTLQVGTYCAKCGTQMKEGDKLCGRCGYHIELQRQITTSNEGPAAKTEGASRWFESILSEGESATGVLILGAVFLALVVFGFCSLLVYTIGAWSLVFILPVLVVAGVIIASIIAIRHQRSQLAEGQPPERQSLAWHMVLSVMRIFRWREPRWPFRKRALLKVEILEFSDEDLKKLPGLADCQVLDLQQTNVTDRGMPYLTGLPKLQFVVVKRTGVTGAGAQLLQHASPDMWIWF